MPDKVAAGQLSYQLRIVVPHGYNFELKDVASVYDKVGASVLKWKRWDVDFDDFVPAEDVELAGVEAIRANSGRGRRARFLASGSPNMTCARTIAGGAGVSTVGARGFASTSAGGASVAGVRA